MRAAVRVHHQWRQLPRRQSARHGQVAVDHEAVGGGDVEGAHLGHLLGVDPGAAVQDRLGAPLLHVHQQPLGRVAIPAQGHHRQLAVVGLAHRPGILTRVGLFQAGQHLADRVLRVDVVDDRQVGSRRHGQQPAGAAIAQEGARAPPSWS